MKNDYFCNQLQGCHVMHLALILNQMSVVL